MCTVLGASVIGDNTDMSRHEACTVALPVADQACTLVCLLSTHSTRAAHWQQQDPQLQHTARPVSACAFADSTAKMGVSMPSSTGWVGLGFPTSPGQMVGATAVIATTSASNGVGIYDLNSQDVSGVNEVSGSSGSNSPTITNVRCCSASLPLHFIAMRGCPAVHWLPWPAMVLRAASATVCSEQLALALLCNQSNVMHIAHTVTALVFRGQLIGAASDCVCSSQRHALEARPSRRSSAALTAPSPQAAKATTSWL